MRLEPLETLVPFAAGPALPVTLTLLVTFPLPPPPAFVSGGGARGAVARDAGLLLARGLCFCCVSVMFIAAGMVLALVGLTGAVALTARFSNSALLGEGGGGLSFLAGAGLRLRAAFTALVFTAAFIAAGTIAISGDAGLGTAGLLLLLLLLLLPAVWGSGGSEASVVFTTGAGDSACGVGAAAAVVFA
jgi:hypothetical protein